MALQSSGYISLNDVNVELDNSGTANINMGSADVRDLFDVASGAIAMSDGYGASSVLPITRGIFGGGYAGGASNVLQYVTIAATGNATDFGDLTVARYAIASFSDATRGIWAGATTTIDYVTIASTGNATDFGDLKYSGRSQIGGCADDTRGIYAGTKRIEYITIQTTGNAAIFGNLTSNRTFLAAEADATRGVFAGGGALNTIDYVTIQTTANAIDFGDLLTSYYYGTGSCADATRALWAGGWLSYATYGTIQYSTIQTTGNATSFGGLSVARYRAAGFADTTRGVFGGGNGSTNVIDYVTIQTTGSATDFGNLAVGMDQFAGCSGG